ncbi:uncharacterized protein [Nicotiana sylvestris]|uniref:uncharacterized protein n=1 Tax=Nicotiana sylvestris TaxID=4096 RepID=UPI00388C7569
MSDIPKYNRTIDPNEDITSYTCRIKGNDLEGDEIESVLLKTFGETLSKGAMIWYHNLPPNSIDSFFMLADSFVKAHAGTIKVSTRKSDVFKIMQRDNEMLREFVSRFQMKRIELPLVTNDWAVQAFTQGLNERSSIASQQFKQNLVKYLAVTWVDVHNQYHSKIWIEDEKLGAPSGSVHPNSLVVKTSRYIDREPRSNRERYQPYTADRRNNGSGRNSARNDRGQNSRGLMSKSGFDKNVDPIEAPRLLEYNFSIDTSVIVLAIRRIKDTRWPGTIQTDPSQINPNLMCKYHGTHGHKTEDCRQLREEIAHLLNKGHLREFLSDRAKNHFRHRGANRKNEQVEPQHVIHMIISGVDIPQRPIFKCTKVSITREKRSRDYVPEGSLSFNYEETEGISQPYNNALVIFILLNKVQVKRVLVDLDSSANIIRSRAVEQRDEQDQIVPAARALNAFNMASEITKGEITLPVNMAGTIQDTKFHVIEGDMRYNALLGRPWIHNMRIVSSTLHQIMKFSTSDGVKIVYGEKHASKEKFAIDEVVPVSTKRSGIKGKLETK